MHKTHNSTSQVHELFIYKCFAYCEMLSNVTHFDALEGDKPGKKLSILKEGYRYLLMGQKIAWRWNEMKTTWVTFT